MHRHDHVPDREHEEGILDSAAGQAGRRRGVFTKSKAQALRVFWSNLPKPLRYFVTAFAFLWLAGIAAQIIRGEFDPIQTLMHFCRAMLAFVGVV